MLFRSPTSGTARFFSPLSVDSFVKKSSFIYYTEDALKKDAELIEEFAKKEGLTAHANSITVRFEDWFYTYPGRQLLWKVFSCRVSFCSVTLKTTKVI